MAIGPWLQRCTPGVSALVVVIFLAFSESFFILYTLFVHLVIFAMPLRIFRGARLATQQIRAALEASQQEADRPGDPLDNNQQSRTSDLTHVTIIPSYKESVETLQDTLRILASHRLAKTTYDIFLAMEERDPNAIKVSEALISKFRPSFLDIQYCLHPSDIPGEGLGKSANVAWTAREVERKYLDRQSFQDVLVTVMDSDTHLLGTYYSLIRKRHHTLRQKSDLAAMTLYCAPIVFDRNAHSVPRLVRAADMGWSCSGLSCFKRPEDYNGIVFPTSVYTLPLSLVSAVGGWDTDPGAIGEDMHMMLKCYFATNGRLNIESIASPASMSNVTSGSTGWSGWIQDHKARYFQGLRHMWGCLDSGYAVVSWYQMGSSSTAGKENTNRNTEKDDMRTTSNPGNGEVDVRASKGQFTWLRNAVLFLRLFEAHILPLHISCILAASSYYSSNLTSNNTSPYLGVVLRLTDYARTVNGILMAISLTTAYADFHKACVEARQWEMRKAGLHEFAFESSMRGRWALGSVLDILSLPITSMLFGTFPLLQAALSHLSTDNLLYRVSGKPTKIRSS